MLKTSQNHGVSQTTKTEQKNPKNRKSPVVSHPEKEMWRKCKNLKKKKPKRKKDVKKEGSGLGHRFAVRPAARFARRKALRSAGVSPPPA